MRIIVSILTIAIFFLASFVSADMILEDNGYTTVTGNMEVQGILIGPYIQRPLGSSGLPK